MALYPDVFKRAQEEIDRVVGHERLPSFSDRENLPYIGAILKETLRWENVLPAGALFLDLQFRSLPTAKMEAKHPTIFACLGAPHVTTEEDVYMGYHIPKGALVMPIIWLVMQLTIHI